MMFNVMLLIVLFICVITDIRNRKIYNKVIFPSLLVTFILQFYANGLSGLSYSFLGFMTGLGILLIPYLLGGMGAGDVKLLALIGAMQGSLFVAITALYMALLGGLMGVCILLFRKGVMSRLRAITYTVCGYRYGLKIPLVLDKDAMKVTYPYGVAIAGGAIMCMFYSRLVIA